MIGKVWATQQFDKISWNIAYTISWAFRQFEQIQNNRPFPFKYDRRHQFNAYINWQFHKAWDISLLWIFNSGHAVSLPTGRIQGEAGNLGDIFIYGDRNNARMPDYHRLDIGVHYKKKGKKGRMNTWSLDIYNLYNRQNAFALLLRQEFRRISAFELEPTGYALYQLSLFPIIPSISYSLKF